MNLKIPAINSTTLNNTSNSSDSSSNGVLCRQTLEAANENNARLFRLAQPRLRKNGKPQFTIITRFGRVRWNRQRMRDPQTGKTMTPSAIVWQASQNQHVMRQVVAAACEVSQKVSYRNAPTNPVKRSGLRPRPLGTRSKRSASSQKLIALVTAQLTLLGLFLGKRWEVVSDGARGIGDGVGGIKGVEVEHILCWYHLCKQIYEGLSALALAKDKRKELEQEILGHLWRGETAHAVWLLWGLAIFGADSATH